MKTARRWAGAFSPGLTGELFNTQKKYFSKEVFPELVITTTVSCPGNAPVLSDIPTGFSDRREKFPPFTPVTTLPAAYMPLQYGGALAIIPGMTGPGTDAEALSQQRVRTTYVS